jgi:Zn-finger nucleic acid-binding protein
MAVMAESSPYADGILRCPACGAGCSPECRGCAHCGNPLAVLRCPGCSALHFVGAVLCTRCGQTLREVAGTPSALPCPRCARPLLQVELDSWGFHECGGCGGLFLQVETLRRVIAQREAAQAVPLPPRPAPVLKSQPVVYVRCPVCKQLMNRVNFGRRSGIIVDVCGQHGTWFDAGELVAALEFVAQGGLQKELRLEREQLEAERRRQPAAAPATLGFRIEPRIAGKGLLELFTQLAEVFFTGWSS